MPLTFIVGMLPSSSVFAPITRATSSHILRDVMVHILRDVMVNERVTDDESWYEVPETRAIEPEIVPPIPITVGRSVANGDARAALAALEVHDAPAILPPLHASNE